MTNGPDPDAPATLRDVAAMMRKLILSARSDNDVSFETGNFLIAVVDELREIATAPAVAKAGDDHIGTGDTIDIREQSQMRNPELWEKSKAPSVEPGPSPDLFAPMVEAAKAAWLKSPRLYGRWDIEVAMRHVIAAALENAPISLAMVDAGWNFMGLGVSQREMFRVMLRTLAAELRGGE